MIKITVGEIVQNIQVLNKFLSKELPIQKAFKLSRALKKIDPELKAFEEQRLKLVKKYGEEKEGQIIVSQINIQKFQEEVDPLLRLELEMDIDPISVKEIDDKFSPVELQAIDKFLKE